MRPKIVLWATGLICVALLGADRPRAMVVPDEVAAFEKRVDEAANAMQDKPSLRDMSHEKRRDIVYFVFGNMLFALLHEMGHTHITEMGLPVLGRDEDAADSFAAVTMIKMRSGFTDNVLVEAAIGWFLSALRDEKDGINLMFYDVHGLDRQRAYQIVCFMVGSDPDRFKALADAIQMPEDRQSSCRGDYSNASWSWDMVMKPHLRTPDQPKTQITVTYGKGEGDLAPYEHAFRAVRMLETVADQAAEHSVWRRPFELRAQTCGEPGAAWDVSTQRLTICYELAAEFTQLYRRYGDRIALPRFPREPRDAVGFNAR